MNRLASLVSIAAAGLLAACSGRAEDSLSEAEPGTTTSDVDTNLRALRELEVFEVGNVIVNIPENANCYCPRQEPVSAEDARARAVEALATFTRDAVAAASSDEADEQLALDGTCYKTDEANLQSLKDLQIVELGAILEKPQASNCYAIPRALKLTRIAHAFRNR